MLFFSRQSNELSGDFLELGRQFEEKGFAPVFMTKKLSSRVAFAVREIVTLREHCCCSGGRRRSRGREGSKGGVDEAQAPHLPVVLGLRCWMRFPLSGHNVLDDTGRLSPLIYLHVGAV